MIQFPKLIDILCDIQTFRVSFYDTFDGYKKVHNEFGIFFFFFIIKQYRYSNNKLWWWKSLIFVLATTIFVLWFLKKGTYPTAFPLSIYQLIKSKAYKFMAISEKFFFVKLFRYFSSSSIIKLRYKSSCWIELHIYMLWLHIHHIEYSVSLWWVHFGV